MGFVFLIITGAVTAWIASNKGRNAIGWFFAGFFFHFIAMIIVACLSDLRQEQAQRERDLLERQRLRERLRQEQLKNEAFRRHATARLDSHDQHLGIQTQGLGQLEAGQAKATPQLEHSPQEEEGNESKWYFEVAGETIGPKSQSALQSLFRKEKLGLTTLVCRENEETWRPASTVPCFRACGPNRI